jgi:hypothetical protein
MLGATFDAVSIACLDDTTPNELAATPVICEGGRNDDWGQPLAVTHHLQSP